MQNNGTQKKTSPNCYGCTHFYITYQRQHPYGCRAMSFKSKDLPSRVVLQNSGVPCQVFEAKVRTGGKPSGRILA